MATKNRLVRNCTRRPCVLCVLTNSENALPSAHCPNATGRCGQGRGRLKRPWLQTGREAMRRVHWLVCVVVNFHCWLRHSRRTHANTGTRGSGNPLCDRRPWRSLSPSKPYTRRCESGCYASEHSADDLQIGLDRNDTAAGVLHEQFEDWGDRRLRLQRLETEGLRGRSFYSAWDRRESDWSEKSVAWALRHEGQRQNDSAHIKRTKWKIS